MDRVSTFLGRKRSMWIWLVVAVVAAIGELLSYDLFLGAVAAAALITGVLAVPIHVVALQVVVFAGLSLVGIAFVRPVVKRMLGIEGLAHDPGALPQTHLHGRRAVVTELVDASGGQIRIGEGEFWTARPFDLT